MCTTTTNLLTMASNLLTIAPNLFATHVNTHQPPKLASNTNTTTLSLYQTWPLHPQNNNTIFQKTPAATCMQQNIQGNPLPCHYLIHIHTLPLASHLTIFLTVCSHICIRHQPWRSHNLPPHFPPFIVSYPLTCMSPNTTTYEAYQKQPLSKLDPLAFLPMSNISQEAHLHPTSLKFKESPTKTPFKSSTTWSIKLQHIPTTTTTYSLRPSDTTHKIITSTHDSVYTTLEKHMPWSHKASTPPKTEPLQNLATWHITSNMKSNNQHINYIVSIRSSWTKYKTNNKITRLHNKQTNPIQQFWWRWRHGHGCSGNSTLD